MNEVLLVKVSRKNKLTEKFRTAKNGFKWSEFESMLSGMGFEKTEGAGSRVLFVHGGDKKLVLQCHRPHPGKEIKSYAVRQAREILKSGGFL